MTKENKLLKAASEGSFKQVQDMLSSKLFGLIKPPDINCRDKDGFTPLIKAAMEGHKEIVSFLIEKGAGSNLTTTQGFTALMGAAKYGHTGIARMLIEKGADIHAEKNGDDAGWNPLMFAASQGKKDIVEILLKFGVKVDACTTKGRWTSLMWAITEGHLETALLLIDGGANVNAQDAKQFTPLMGAAKYGHPEIAKILIERGADINATKIGEDEGWSPLMFAASYGKTEVVKLLLEHGADIDSKTRGNWTAIMWAARDGFEDIVTLLIEKGAQVNQRADKGYNALGLASFNGHFSIVKRLVDAGADLNAKDEETGTPLEGARKKNHQEIVNYLLAHGAKDTPAVRIAVEGYFEVPFPMFTARCSDNQCPCPETSIPKGEGYLYISQDVVNNRRNARTETEAALLAEKLKQEYERRTGAIVMMDFKDILTPILMCETGAKLRGIDMETALNDAKHWWKTGKVPLRPTPMGRKSSSESAAEKQTAIEATDAGKNNIETAVEPDSENKSFDIQKITQDHLSISLVESRALGDAGPGGESFQQAIQNLNKQDYDRAADNFKYALSKGLDPLRQGYAHANIGEILLKKQSLPGAIEEFVKVLSSKQALYESVHSAVQYLSIILMEVGRQEEATALQQLASKTSARLGYSLSPSAAEEVRCLVRATLSKT